MEGNVPICAVVLPVASVNCSPKMLNGKESQASTVLSCKSYALMWVAWWHLTVLPRPTQATSDLRAACATCLLTTGWPSGVWDRLQLSACNEVTLILLNHARKQKFRYAKGKPWSASFKWEARSFRLNKEREKDSSTEVAEVPGKHNSVKLCRRKEKLVLILRRTSNCGSTATVHNKYWNPRWKKH